MRRTDLDDTSIEVHKLSVQLLREKGPQWRLRKTFELMDWSRSTFYEQTKRALLADRKR